MSVKDPRQLKWSAIIATIWNVFLAGGALMIGILARSYFPESFMLPNGDIENAYISLAELLLPTALVGILLASVFAAIMSTADSQLLIAASSLVRDFYHKTLYKHSNFSEKKLIFYSRITIGGLVYLAVILATSVEDMVFWFVLFAWAGLGASIGPASILALYRPRTTKNGVMAGMIAGALTVFLWKSSPFLSGWLYELIPSFLAGWVVTFWVSEFDWWRWYRN